MSDPVMIRLTEAWKDRAKSLGLEGRKADADCNAFLAGASMALALSKSAKTADDDEDEAPKTRKPRAKKTDGESHLKAVGE